MTTYGKIENNKYIPATSENVEGYSAFDEVDVANYFTGLCELSDGTNTAIRLTEIYKANLQNQIDEFDKKRIRAGFEPSVKDETTGQTWLEYYTLQIADLRDKIIELN